MSRVDMTTAFASDIALVIKRKSKDLARVDKMHSSTDRANVLALVVRDIVDACGFVVIGGRLMYYRAGFYSPIDPKWVVSAVKGALMDAGIQPMDVKKIGNVPFVGLEQNVVDEDFGFIHFANGVIVDINTGKSVAPSRERYVTRCLDVRWCEDAVTQRWDRFLDRVLPDETQRMVLQEFLGLCLVDRRRISIEKFLVLIGTGANGKSVIFDVVKGVLGADNVSFLDPQQLADPRQLAFADGKLINFSPDVRAGAAFDSALKSLSSGQDVNAWKLFQGSMPMRCPPLVFALNAMPRILDTSGAFFRRLLVIRFGVTIPPREQDRRLASKIVKDEGAGVLQWMMRGASRLLSNGGEFTHSEAMDRALQDMKGCCVVEDVQEPPVMNVTVDEMPYVPDVPADESPAFDADSWLAAHGWSPFPAYLGQDAQTVPVTAVSADSDTESVARGMERAGVVCDIQNGEIYFKLYRR